MFGFIRNRTQETKKAEVVLPPTPQPATVTRENVKVGTGNTFINVQYLVDAFTGARGLNMPVGREVVDGTWYTLFIRTKNGEIVVDKHGNTILNRR